MGEDSRYELDKLDRVSNSQDQERLAELIAIIPEADRLEADKQVAKQAKLHSNALSLDDGVKEVLSYVDKTKVTAPIKALLGEMVKQVKEINPNVKLVIGNPVDKDNQGEYYLDSNTVTIHMDLLKKQKEDFDNEVVITLTHELAHSITAVNLESVNFAQEKAILNKARERVEKALQDSSKTQGLSKRDLNMLEYAVTDPHELLVISMSDNLKVQKFIHRYADFARIKEAKDYVSNGENVFVALLKRLLGLSTKGFEVYQSLVSNIINSKPYMMVSMAFNILFEVIP